MTRKKRDQLSELDLLDETKTVTKGDAVILGYFEVPKGMSYELGFGSLEGQHSAEGRIFAEIKDDADEEVKGDIIFQALSPQKQHRADIDTFRTTATNTDLQDRRKQLPLSRYAGKVTESAYVAIAFRADGDSGTETISRDNSEILIDMTKYSER